MKNKLKIGVTLFFAITLLMGCTSTFDDINTDPNRLSQVPPTNILATVLRGTASEFGNDIDVFGTFAGYVVKIQYPDDLSGLIPTNNSYGNKWYQCYYAMTQLNIILENTDESARIRYVCRIWENFMWQYLLDIWGDVPYSEALKGADDKGGILYAKYDKQEDIYPAVLASLKEIADEISVSSGSGTIGEGDFIYGGDILKWQKFCNSLRLRIAMRISAVSPALAKSTVEEICGNPTKYPIIETNAESCIFWWPGATPYYEPWYDNKLGRDDFGVFDILINQLKATNDPRLAAIAHPATLDNEYRGYQNGAPTANPLSIASRFGAIYRDDAAGFTPFYKACETYYIIAEAAMLGWNVGMTAQAAYERAVRLSMAENKVSDADANTYLTGSGQWDNTKERIWWDMWVALFKENYEAWSLYRRTGIPSTNYPSIRSKYGSAHTDQPFRSPYPGNEYLYNTDNLNEAISRQGIVDYCWGGQLWWDKRTGVK